MIRRNHYIKRVTQSIHFGGIVLGREYADNIAKENRELNTKIKVTASRPKQTSSIEQSNFHHPVSLDKYLYL